MSNDNHKLPRTLTEHLVLLLATGLGTGRSPWAPGTVGSGLGLAWAWVVAALPQSFSTDSSPGLPVLGLLVTLAAAIVAIPVCTRACRLLDLKDPGQVVLDEIVAVPLVFGCGLLPTDLVWLATGFVVFRIFDILKPPPIVQAERLPDGTGIVADDMVAGLCAGLVLWGLHATYRGLLAAGDLLPPTSFG
ncbi:MAG: phosphatidylglycerophosphatase A [Planctomycetota bacterium]|nr:phosphatidylglycerophosphatase A [Planctomycetota bacterium]